MNAKISITSTILVFIIALSATAQIKKQLFYGDTPTLLQNPYGWGYIAGSNSYGDVGKYQKFTAQEDGNLVGTTVYLAYYSTVDDADSLTFVMRTIQENGKPGQVVTAVKESSANLQTGLNGNYIKFLEEILVMKADSFFIGVEFSGNDTLAIYTDADGEGDNANRAWEQFSDGDFNDFQSVFHAGFSWDIDVDLWITAEMTVNLDLEEYGYMDSPNLLANPYGEGYIAGRNSYGDVGKYQLFEAESPFTLYGGGFYFGVMNIEGEADTLDIVVRDVAEDGKPGVMITKVRVLTSEFSTDSTGDAVMFDEQLAFKTGQKFFIGYEWSSSSDDTFALLSDANGEGDNANRAWEQFSDGDFNDFQTVFHAGFSWGIDVDLWISALGIAEEGTFVESVTEQIASDFILHQNYPNPFNPTTSIRFDLSQTSQVELTVYSILGQQMATLLNGAVKAGSHTVNFDASTFSSGVYFYQLSVDGNQVTKTMTLLK